VSVGEGLKPLPYDEIILKETLMPLPVGKIVLGKEKVRVGRKPGSVSPLHGM
jgi:hypothetical protein